MSEVTIDGVKYWQPECHCDGTGHICYLRPIPQTANIDIEKLMTGGNLAPKSEKENTV